MDCNMPFMDGYEATQKIRSFFSSNEMGGAQPLIVAVTGHTEQPYLDRCIKCGMDKALSKPIDHFSI